MIQVDLILLNNDPMHESSHGSNSDMPKESHKVLSLTVKVKVLDLTRKEKKLLC